MLDLFSGIGGFHLAAEWVWGDELNVLAHCEIESFPQKVLRKHWPAVPIVPDIHDLKGDQFGTVDIITGGFPCQPYSVAGKRKGAADDRALWPQMLRVIEEARPRWVLGENVAGFINMGLDDSLADLARIGYTAWPVVIPACAIDARHRRDRTWIMAYSGSDIDWKKKRRSIIETKRIQKFCEQKNCTSGKPCGASEFWGASNKYDAADTSKHGFVFRQTESMHGQEEYEPDTRNAWSGGKVMADSECISIQGNWTARKQEPIMGQCIFETERGFEALGKWREWPTEPAVGRVAHGIPDRVDRLKGLGNAIVPQVAEKIMRAIKQVDEMEIMQ